MEIKEMSLDEAEFDEDLNKWLSNLANTCFAHIKYIEECEAETPTGLTEEDYDLLTLEQGFLVLYSLHTKGGMPVNTATKGKH